MLNTVIAEWKETLRLSVFQGYNSIAKFYSMLEEYEQIKRVECKICAVCGSRRRTPESKLNDAVDFLHLLALDEDEASRFEDLVESDNDRVGKLAQKCFHIEKLGEKYYAFLNLEEDKYYFQ